MRGFTKSQETCINTTAPGYPLPGSTINNAHAENVFLTKAAMLENGVNSGLNPSSFYLYLGNALQLTEPILQKQMTTVVSSDKQSNPLKATSSSFDTADLPEEAHELSKTMPDAVGPAVQKRVAEPIFPLQSKKLKGDSLLQTLDQMNGIMSVCGVNAAEEVSQMLPKLTEKRRYLVQEERDRLFLEKKPLQEKLITLANNRGVSFVNEDVELCLSMSLEELFRSILIRLFRFSDQSEDVDKDNPKLLVTSNVGAQISMLRQKAGEALNAKELAGQKRAENLSNENKRVMEVEAAPKLKSQAGKKQKKAAKESASKGIALQTAETDKMLIKWQIMAEQARLKRVSEAGSQSLQKKSEELAGTPSTSLEADSGRPPGNNSEALTTQPKKSITVSDLISVLEMDSHMAKSAILYQLYNKVHTKLQQ